MLSSMIYHLYCSHTTLIMISCIFLTIITSLVWYSTKTLFLNMSKVIWNIRRLPTLASLISLILLATIIYHLSSSTETHPTLETNPTFENPGMIKISQDDPDLISHIRSHYLVPPAEPTVPLNLTKKMWNSPLLGVVHKILGYKTGGYFLECGAFDGEFLSNTIELETNLNWKGVLVEADPKYHKDLLSKRRKSWIAPVCLSPTPHQMKIRMVRHKEWGALSHIPELKTIEHDRKDYPFSFEVQCFPLYSVVVAALNRTEIDYLSLDVEGAELMIFRTIPFDKLTIKVISVEYNDDEKVRPYLESKGYVYQTFVKIKDGYTHDFVFAHPSVL